MGQSQNDIASLFEHLVSTNSEYSVKFLKGESDTVIFKDVYLYVNGLNVKYFSKRANDLKISLWEEIDQINGRSILSWLSEAKIKEVPPTKTLTKSRIKHSSLHSQIDKGEVPKVKLLITVNKLTELIKNELKQTKFQNIWVTGEISNLTLASSGHAYFSLKDEKATIQSVMFRSNLSSLKYKLENGLKVEAFGGIDVYEPRGNYQLILKNISPEGIGDLQLAFEQLKKQLTSEGLFELKYKKPIPKYPETLGIITSPTGAAIRDMIKTTQIEFPKIKIIIYPSLVQGEKAANQIVDMIELANKHNRCDVLIIGRGGGSVEDLWVFNEETVARAIFASQIPIISAIGHEVDFSISDFVADYRAATPTSAAEIISIHKKELNNVLAIKERKIALNMNRRIQRIISLLDRSKNEKLMGYVSRMYQISAQRSDELEKHFKICIQQRYKDKYNDFLNKATKLDALSPFKVLQRGYSVVYDKSGKIIKEKRSVNSGDEIQVSLFRGDFKARVT